jgi:hypothetical protein
MVKHILIIWILILSSFSCESPDSYPDKIPDGTYTGTFQRQLVTGNGEIANVSITFCSNTWSGQSDKSEYPALCNGTYKIEKQKIIFVNDCVWTAEFDWSLILGGEYNYVLEGAQLKITRYYQRQLFTDFTDTYTLTKQK